jgi:hypothetical protein
LALSLVLESCAVGFFQKRTFAVPLSIVQESFMGKEYAVVGRQTTIGGAAADRSELPIRRAVIRGVEKQRAASNPGILQPFIGVPPAAAAELLRHLRDLQLAERVA